MTEQGAGGFVFEQGSGGYSVIVCHDCHQPVATVTGTWFHLDNTPLCYEVLNDEVR